MIGELLEGCARRESLSARWRQTYKQRRREGSSSFTASSWIGVKACVSSAAATIDDDLLIKLSLR